MKSFIIHGNMFFTRLTEILETKIVTCSFQCPYIIHMILCMFNHVLNCYVCLLFLFLKYQVGNRALKSSCSMLYLYRYASDFK